MDPLLRCRGETERAEAAAACQAEEVTIALAALHLRCHRSLNRSLRDTWHSAQTHGDVVPFSCRLSAICAAYHRPSIRLRSPSRRCGRYLELTFNRINHVRTNVGYRQEKMCDGTWRDLPPHSACA